MTGSSPPQFGTLPRGALAAILVLTVAGVLALLAPAAGLAGRLVTAAASLAVTVTDGGLAVMILASAGGWGFLLVRRLLPRDAPAPLRIFTACGAGLWALAAAVLAAGSAFPYALTGWVWWPVVAAGLVLAAWAGRARMEAWRIPARFDGRALAWVLVAVAAAFWISGAVSDPRAVGWTTGDRYDVLEYHLQVPREYYEAGRMERLDHNVYSNYPLGLENLFLIAMCLRGGPWQGAHAAAFLHGGLAALAVAAVFLTLRRDDETRARFSAVLLATTPAVVFLARLAMVEMAQLFYLTLALLWLRRWLQTPTRRDALCLALALGGACATKYLAAGFVVAPLLAVMAAAALRRRQWRLLAHPVAAGLVALLLTAPWLIRNAVNTGNPVFPLATQALGRGHWSQEQEQRWINGHSPGVHPPVPQPAGWQAPTAPGRGEMFVAHFLTQGLFGYLTMLVAGMTLALLIADRDLFGAWDVALVGVLAVQLAFWAAFTRDMPWRFVVPAMLPVTLLAGEGLGKLSRKAASPFRPASAAGALPWGRLPAVGVLIAAVAVNIIIGANITLYDGAEILSGPEHQSEYPSGSRVLLVGEAQAFADSAFTSYATAFDENPLAAMIRRGLTGPQIAAELRRRGITHLLVNWAELWRLAGTYGYDEAITGGLYRRAAAGQGADLPVLEALRAAGLTVLDEVRPTSRPASRPAAPSKEWSPFRPPPDWPLLTAYQFPWSPKAPR